MNQNLGHDCSLWDVEALPLEDVTRGSEKATTKKVTHGLTMRYLLGGGLLVVGGSGPTPELVKLLNGGLVALLALWSRATHFVV